MKSKFSAPHAIVKALQTLESLNKGTPEILTPGVIKELVVKLAPETTVSFIDGKAVIGNTDPLNEFLTAKGFSLKFPTKGTTDITTVGIIDISVKWKHEGFPMETRFNDALVDGPVFNAPAYKAASFDRGVLYFSSSAHPNPIAKLTTHSNVDVFVTVFDRTLPNDFVTLQQEVTKIQKTLIPSKKQFSNLYLPCINVAQQDSLPILDDVHISLNNQTFVTSGSKYEAILKLDEKGAIAKAAAGTTLCAASCLPQNPPLIIDRPFLIWFVQNNIVYFAAHIYSDSLIVSPNE
jgi:hypothetical protein